MIRIFQLLFCLLAVNVAFAQSIKKSDKFIGTWRYQYDLGTEVWKLENEVLVGESFRHNRMGDSTKVEDLRIRMAGKLTIHEWTTFNVVGDTLLTNSATFVSRNSALDFYNVDGVTPYSIAYSFGFLNRNKLIIKIRFGVKEKAVRYKLIRSKN